MPTLLIRQQLLRDAFKYARKLQELRRRATNDLNSDSSRNSDTERSRGSDDSLTDTDSSLSSTSFESLDDDIAAGYEADSDSDDNMSTDTEEDQLYMKRLAALHERFNHLTDTHVLFPNRVHKLSQLYLVLVLYKEDNHKRFRRNLRVNPETFDELMKRIEGNPIFTSDGPQDQLPLDEQLAIALFRFGHHGNAASVEAIAQWAGASAGTVVNVTRRVIVAFLTLHDTVIRWPSAREREEAKEWVEVATCVAWRNGWFFVDGTLVPLAEKPGYHGEAYFDRKSNYSLNVQVSVKPKEAFLRDTNGLGTGSLLLFRTCVSSTMLLDIVAAHTTQPLFKTRAQFMRNNGLLDLENGYGLTLLIRWKLGVLHHSRSLLQMLQRIRFSTTGFHMYVSYFPV